MNASQIQMLIRLLYSEDGKAFIEILEQMSKDNYLKIKQSPAELHGIYIGRAQAIDEIKDLILDSENKHIELKDKLQQQDRASWSL